MIRDAARVVVDCPSGPRDHVPRGSHRKPLYGTAQHHTVTDDEIAVHRPQKTADCSEKLYTRYKKVYEEYISKVVLQTLRESHDEYFLKSLVDRWKNHKLLTKWLSKIFNYLDRYYIVRYNLPKLTTSGSSHSGAACTRRCT